MQCYRKRTKKYGHRLVNLKKTNRFAVIADNASLTGLNEFKLNNESDSNYNTVFRWLCDALYLMNIEYDVIPADPALFASYEIYLCLHSIAQQMRCSMP